MTQEDTPAKQTRKPPSKVVSGILAVIVLGIFIGNFLASGRLQKILDSESPVKAALPFLVFSSLAAFLMLKSEKRFPNLNPIFVLFGVLGAAIALILRLLS